MSPTHAEAMAGYARKETDLYRSYSSFSTDPDMLEWAEAMAAAKAVEAVAYEDYANAVRSQQAVA